MLPLLPVPIDDTTLAHPQMKPSFAISTLKNPLRYVKLIDRLFEKYKKRGRLLKEDQLGINALLVRQEQSGLANLLSRLVSSGQYSLALPETRKILIGKKVRDISSYHLVDTLAQSAVYEWLMEDAEQFVSSSVYSYLRGRSGQQAITAFVNYIQQQRNAKGHIDLFVFRADLASYTDTIPVDQHSELWAQLKTVVAAKALAPEENSYVMQIIENALRPIKSTEFGELYQNNIGIPTGSSFSTLAGLLYLTELDKTLAELSGGFYARYGDDILFAHSDWHVFKQGEAYIDSFVQHLRLKRNLSKEQRIYYTKAGRRHSEHPELTGSQVVNYLGFSIDASGTIGLPPAKCRVFLQRLRQRATRCARLFVNLPLDERGRALCQAINRMLNPKHPLNEPRSINILRNIDNRACLKELDYSIALMVAELVSGVSGVKAWRVIPYRKIRQQWRLRSLCQRKNQQGI